MSTYSIETTTVQLAEDFLVYFRSMWPLTEPEARCLYYLVVVDYQTADSDCPYNEQILAKQIADEFYVQIAMPTAKDRAILMVRWMLRNAAKNLHPRAEDYVGGCSWVMHADTVPGDEVDQWIYATRQFMDDLCDGDAPEVPTAEAIACF